MDISLPDLTSRGAAFAGFWSEPHYCTLSTPRTGGPPHVVPVGVTLDVERGVARVICARTSDKARLVADGGERGIPVALCQMDGRRWSTLEGRALLRDDRYAVAEAEREYAERYRTPTVDPLRVVLEVLVTGVRGTV
ncbi:Pyridoxamine 5'-phosphate oxidase [Haloechinothrix alba]|uniref:Pyridoxamine 5'-phosphate oxidase n=1 Tax=Haloechinothrix alba TaxID=664784 RepID=A0A238WPE0_9PSEU|nr:pyridoxamine 5'-phosphate oxidase family protein [Haloechinothrix alba]SNR48337.1 Pyridoxamine 5'-phosphate oxidase [Haloechinothrix alba]